MNRGLFLLVACLIANVCGNVLQSKVPMPDGRIVGGQDTSIDKFPYQVSVQLLGSHVCGGSIYDSRTIVTAGHCIYSISPSYYSVAYGSTNVSGGKSIVAKRLIKHPQYSASVIDYDAAIIILQEDIKLGAGAQPIALASQEPAAGSKAVVSGWGTTQEGGSVASILQKVEVNIVQRAACSKQYSSVNAITERMICAGVPQGGKDACQGDSGGPLVANGKLVGIVSWGSGCARPGLSGVYTNVANVKAWIDENVPKRH